jgi:hypothetical protein
MVSIKMFYYIKQDIMKKNIKIIITRKDDLNGVNDIELPEIKIKEEKNIQSVNSVYNRFLLKLYNFYSKNRLYILFILFFIIYIYNKPTE